MQVVRNQPAGSGGEGALLAGNGRGVAGGHSARRHRAAGAEAGAVQPGAFARELALAQEAAQAGSTEGLDPRAFAPPDQFGIGPTKAARQAALRWAAQQLEAVFFHLMLQGMRRTVDKSGLFGNSTATNLYESMLDEHLAAQIGPQAGLGLADAIVRQLDEAEAGSR